MPKNAQTAAQLHSSPKITADGDCSHEIKRHLLLGRKDMTNLDSILKSRDITLPTKVRLVKVLACKRSAIVQWFEHSLALPFFGIRMKTDLFQSCGHC